MLEITNQFAEERTVGSIRSNLQNKVACLALAHRHAVEPDKIAAAKVDRTIRRISDRERWMVRHRWNTSMWSILCGMANSSSRPIGRMPSNGSMIASEKS